MEVESYKRKRRPKDPYLKRCKAPEYIRKAWRDYKRLQRQRKQLEQESDKPKLPRKG